MDLPSPEESLTDKINSSVKKSHKISIYSKKNTKSPKKHQHSTVTRFQQTRDFNEKLILGGDKMTEVANLNALKFSQSKNHHLLSNTVNELNGGSHRIMSTMNIVDLSRQNTTNNMNNRGIATRQMSYHEKAQESNFFDQTTPLIRKANTQQQNTFVTGSNQNQLYYQNRNASNNSNNKQTPVSQPAYEHSANNISQMIDKEAESQLNNLSVLQGSFLTGVRNNSLNHQNMSHNSSMNQIPLPLSMKQKDSQASSDPTQQQQYIMNNFMKFMQEQIYIAKEKCEKRVTDLMKENIKATKELRERLAKNEMLLKEKSHLIEKLRKGNVKKIQSQGEIMIKESHKAQNQDLQSNSYYEKRIHDLQMKISILHSVISEKTHKTDQFSHKIQTLQKQLIAYNHSKLKILSSKFQSFISKSQEKIHSLYQNYEKLRISFQKHRNQQQQYGFNQNQIKQKKLKISNIQKELSQFMSKEFKYENFNILQLQQTMNHFKDQLRKFENMQFENSKLIKQIMSNGHIVEPQHKNIQRVQPHTKIITLSNINETASKYTVTNPNMSKISISDLSNTNQYSHLIEKISPNQKNFPQNNYHNASHSRSNSESLISMNFTEDPSESMTARMKGADSVRYQNDMISNIAMSKYTKNTDLKETCSQLQVSPPSASKYYLPTTKTSISIHSIMAPDGSSTQEKIRNLNDLKMETLPLLHSNKQTPQKFANAQQNLQNSSKKSIYYANLSQLQQSLDQNNASYLSIGQMEDFNVSRREIANETNDFSDDEFFYPGYKEDAVNQWESPQKSYKTTERFMETEQFSPMKKKLMSTEQHFYQSTKSPEVNGMQQSREKPMFMYNSSLDYEKFSDDEEEDQKQVTQTYEMKKTGGNSQNRVTVTQYKMPLPLSQQSLKSQNFTVNQQRVVNSLKAVKKQQLPIKMIYDKKKCEGVMRTIETGHILNGKSWVLEKKEIQKLQALGYVQVKTYI